MKTFTLLDTFSLDGFYLTQSYGVNHSYYSKFGLLYHEGTDLSHSNKTKPVKACHDGECLTAYSKAYGNYVIVIDYKQLCATFYCHLSQVNVVNGQQVKAGNIIGNMGNTGNTTGPHVHFNFVQVDRNGSRLYQTKTSNYGFLDPRHPLDPRNPTYPPGVGEYKIEWVKDTNMSVMYKGLDLTNQASMKVAIDFWADLRDGKYVKAEKYEEAMGEVASLQAELAKLKEEVKAERDAFAQTKETKDAEIERQKRLVQQYFDIVQMVARLMDTTQDYNTIHAQTEKLIKGEDQSRQATQKLSEKTTEWEKKKSDLETAVIVLEERLRVMKDFKVQELSQQDADKLVEAIVVLVRALIQRVKNVLRSK